MPYGAQLNVTTFNNCTKFICFSYTLFITNKNARYYKLL